MKRMLLLVLAINLSACNMLDGISGSSSSTTGSSVTEDSSSSTDEGSDILTAEESTTDDSATTTDSEEVADDDSSDSEEVATDDSTDSEEVASDEETDESEETEVAVEECSLTDFFNGQLQVCGERVTYLFTDANGGEQSVMLSEFQVLQQGFHVVTSFYSGKNGSFLNFPADHVMTSLVTIAIPKTIAANGLPGSGHELVLQINSDTHCIYTSYANRGYRSPVCYQGSSLLDDGTVQVNGAIQVPASIFTDVLYVRAHIRMANGNRVLTTASIDLQLIAQ